MKIILWLFILIGGYSINLDAQILAPRFAGVSKQFKGSGNLLYRAYAYTNSTFVLSASDFTNYFKNAVASSQAVGVKSIGKYNNAATSNTINLLNWASEGDINGLSLGYTFGDNFLYKAEGVFIPKYSGTYTFTIEGDDAVDLFINSTNVANHYDGHGTSTLGTHTGTITLVAGTLNYFRIRHEEVGGGAAIRLFWRKPSETTGWYQDPDEIAALSSINEAARWSASSYYQGNNTFNGNLSYPTSGAGSYLNTPWLDSPQGWSAGSGDANPWIIYDIGSAQWVLGIVTQGREEIAQWVTTAKVEYSLDNNVNTTWVPIFSNVSLNTDQTTKKIIEFPRRVNARYIKVSPLTESGYKTMRLGVIY
jgi:hypothetical protein